MCGDFFKVQKALLAVTKRPLLIVPPLLGRLNLQTTRGAKKFRASKGLWSMEDLSGPFRKNGPGFF